MELAARMWRGVSLISRNVVIVVKRLLGCWTRVDFMMVYIIPLLLKLSSLLLSGVWCRSVIVYLSYLSRLEV